MKQPITLSPRLTTGIVCLLACFYSLSGFATSSDHEMEKQLELAVKKLDEAERRSHVAEKGLKTLKKQLGNAFNQFNRIAEPKGQLHQLQQQISEQYQQTINAKETVCAEAQNIKTQSINTKNINKRDLAILQSAVSKSAAQIKQQSQSINTMSELRQQQVKLAQKVSVHSPVDEAKQLFVIADVSGLLQDAEDALKRAGKTTGLVYFARQHGIELNKIKQTIEKVRVFRDQTLYWRTHEETITQLLASQSQRIEHANTLLAESLVCLAQIKNRLKTIQAEADKKSVAARSVADSPVSKNKHQGKWYVFCSGQTSVAKYLRQMPQSTSLGIGEFDNQAEAQAFAQENNRDNVCSASTSHCPPGSVAVPNLTGLASAAVASTLAARNLLPGSVQQQTSYSTPKDKVISQIPYVDTCAAPLTRVNVVVSSGADAPDTSGPKVVTGLFIQPASEELHVGQTRQFDAIAEFSDGRNDVVTHQAKWGGEGIGNKFVASKPGVFTLTATLNGTSRSATIIVKDYQLTAVTIDPASATLHGGETIAFRLDANYEHSKFEDATHSAIWSTGMPQFSSNSPGIHWVSAHFKGKTALARIEVLTPKPQNANHNDDDLAAAMMNDPTRSPGSDSARSGASSNDAGLDDFASVPVAANSGSSGISSTTPTNIDLDREAQTFKDARQSRDDDLYAAQQQQDRHQQQSWNATLAADRDDLGRQRAQAQQDLQASQAQGQDASAAGMAALDKQRQQQEDFQARMDALEAAAAQSASSGSAKAANSGASGDSGGLSSVTVSQNAIDISIWDHGIIDGDIIILKINGNPVTQKITLKGPNEPFIYHANLPGKTNRIEIFAVNEGTSPPNTASVSTSHVVQGQAKQKYKINQDENASYGITVSY